MHPELLDLIVALIHVDHLVFPRSLPRPLPLPLDSPSPSSAAACFGAGLLPKLMGFSSRHWHAHTPTDVITVALHIWSIHQRRFAGSACE
jgi:hypothetical protein